MTSKTCAKSTVLHVSSSREVYQSATQGFRAGLAELLVLGSNVQPPVRRQNEWAISLHSFKVWLEDANSCQAEGLTCAVEYKCLSKGEGVLHSLFSAFPQNPILDLSTAQLRWLQPSAKGEEGAARKTKITCMPNRPNPCLSKEETRAKAL